MIIDTDQDLLTHIRLRRIAAQRATSRLDRSIRRALEAGVSYARIAEVAGVSHSTLHYRYRKSAVPQTPLVRASDFLPDKH